MAYADCNAKDEAERCRLVFVIEGGSSDVYRDFSLYSLKAVGGLGCVLLRGDWTVAFSYAGTARGGCYAPG